MTAERDFRMTDDHKAEALDLDALEATAKAATAGPSSLAFARFLFRIEPAEVLALIAALKEARERVADVWDEGHKAPWRRGPDSCRCSAWSSGECACGMYGNGELLSLNDNPYRRSETP